MFRISDFFLMQEDMERAIDRMFYSPFSYITAQTQKLIDRLNAEPTGEANTFSYTLTGFKDGKKEQWFERINNEEPRKLTPDEAKQILAEGGVRQKVEQKLIGQGEIKGKESTNEDGPKDKGRPQHARNRGRKNGKGKGKARKARVVCADEQGHNQDAVKA